MPQFTVDASRYEAQALVCVTTDSPDEARRIFLAVHPGFAREQDLRVHELKESEPYTGDSEPDTVYCDGGMTYVPELGHDIGNSTCCGTHGKRSFEEVLEATVLEIVDVQHKLATYPLEAVEGLRTELDRLEAKLEALYAYMKRPK